MEAIIFDIDGTISDVSHRLHLVRNKEPKWDLFFKGIMDDPPIKPVLELVQVLIRDNGKAVLFVTGRPETLRNDTIEWLQKNGVDIDFNSCLFMRKESDRRPDYIIKRAILHEIRSKGFDPVLVFDDRQSVVDMWRNQGIMVAQMAPGDP